MIPASNFHSRNKIIEYSGYYLSMVAVITVWYAGFLTIQTRHRKMREREWTSQYSLELFTWQHTWADQGNSLSNYTHTAGENIPERVTDRMSVKENYTTAQLFTKISYKLWQEAVWEFLHSIYAWCILSNAVAVWYIVGNTIAASALWVT